MITITGKIPF
ncbi:rCG40247, partial [Rattus norvegicus]